MSHSLAIASKPAGATGVTTSGGAFVDDSRNHSDLREYR